MEYAKSPQAVVFEEFIRIYFSACKKDGDKLISYVCFADFSKDFKKTIRVLKQILPDGNPGCFDEHGIFPFSPMEYEGRIYGYTSGWSRRRSVSVDTGIGLAGSDDGGESFVRVGEGSDKFSRRAFPGRGRICKKISGAVSYVVYIRAELEGV